MKRATSRRDAVQGWRIHVRRRGWWYAGGGGLALTLFCALWAFWIGPGRLVVREVELVLPLWAAEHAGLRVAVLTDLHVGSPRQGEEMLRRIVRETNAVDPDVIVLLGDLVTQGMAGGRFVEPERIAGTLADLEAPLGTFAVLGNHDAWFDAERVARALRENGIPVLEDSAASIEWEGRSFWISGVSDLWTGAHNVGAALADVPDDAPVLLITHNPDVFPEIPARVSLTLAGHTHGGQVKLPVIGAPIVPSRFGQRYAAGHVVEGGRHLYVGTGTGTSIVPVRLGVPPEVVVLTLSRAGPVSVQEEPS